MLNLGGDGAPPGGGKGFTLLLRLFSSKRGKTSEDLCGSGNACYPLKQVKGHPFLSSPYPNRVHGKPILFFSSTSCHHPPPPNSLFPKKRRKKKTRNTVQVELCFLWVGPNTQKMPTNDVIQLTRRLSNFDGQRDYNSEVYNILFEDPCRVACFNLQT